MKIKRISACRTMMQLQKESIRQQFLAYEEEALNIMKICISLEKIF